jgi:hypothetical protein
MIIEVQNYIPKQAPNVDVSKKYHFTIAFFQFPERHVNDEIWNVDSSENSDPTNLGTIHTRNTKPEHFIIFQQVF